MINHRAEKNKARLSGLGEMSAVIYRRAGAVALPAALRLRGLAGTRAINDRKAVVVTK